MSEPAATELPGESFERWRQRIGLGLGPALALLAWWLGQGSASPALAGLLVLCVTWWLTEALPMAVVGLVAAVGAVVTGLAKPEVAFGAFGYPLLYLFIGSFFIAEAMRVHGLGERLASAMAGRAHSRLSLLVVVSIVAFTLSTVMSNTAATAIVLPIALAAAAAIGDARLSTALVLAVAWGASVGGLGTPVGTPPNLIGLRELREHGIELSFLGWMAIGVPVGLVLLAGMIGVLCLFFGIRRKQPLAVRLARTERPWNRGEIAVLACIALALTGWLLPSLLQIAVPGSPVERWVAEHVTEEVVAVVAGCLLFVLPGGSARVRRPALTWDEAIRIDWSLILLFGGGVLLGKLAKQTGLVDEWGGWLVQITGAGSTWSIVALVTAASILLSEATSNTATATLMAPLAAGLAAAAHAAPVPSVLGATLGASFGFMMPISTAPNAMAYATRKVTVGQMARAGVIFDVVGFVLIVGGLRLFAPLFGWS